MRTLVDGLWRHAGTRRFWSARPCWPCCSWAASCSTPPAAAPAGGHASAFSGRSSTPPSAACTRCRSPITAPSVGATMTRLDRGVQGVGSAFAELVFKLFPALVYLGLSAAMMARLNGVLTCAIMGLMVAPALIGMLGGVEADDARPRAARSLAEDLRPLQRGPGRHRHREELRHGARGEAALHAPGRRRQRSGPAGRDLRCAAWAPLQNLLTGGARILVLAYGGYLALTRPAQRRDAAGVPRLPGRLRAPGAGADRPLPDLAPRGRLAGRGLLDPGGGGPRARRRPTPGRPPAARRGDVRRRRLRLPGGPPGAARDRPAGVAGRDGGAGRSERRRKDHAHGALAAAPRSRAGERSASTGSTSATSPSARCAARSAWCCRTRCCSTTRSAPTSPTAAPTPRAAEIEAAARAANAHDFITALPERLRHLRGRAGRLLSAGQRQRIAIARALLRIRPS